VLLIIDDPPQTLIQNGLRERVILRVDGGFKSGVDVLMAAAMGADEYGFGSVAMIATGCVMARICHTNNCPVGVASQVKGRFVISFYYFLFSFQTELGLNFSHLF
jgi:glutamate synthase domain-containing protein 2